MPLGAPAFLRGSFFWAPVLARRGVGARCNKSRVYQGRGWQAEGVDDQARQAEEALRIWGSGTQDSKAGLRNGVVFRQPGPWSPTVVALLCHLEAEGFGGAPRVVGTGFGDDGRETLTFVPGTTPHPHAWDDEAMVAIGALLRDLHLAASTFRPPFEACWKPWFARALRGSDPVIGHGDTGPWNIVRSGDQFSLIDWEFAGPVDALWELAQATWLNAQLHDDDVAERFNLPDAQTRARQVRLLIDAYGLSSQQRDSFVDRMIEFAIHAARQEAVQYEVVPETDQAISETGFPILWSITWRTRSASWMLHHRTILEHALR